MIGCNDIEDFVIICLVNIIVDNDFGQCGVVVNIFNFNVFDDCLGVIFEYVLVLGIVFDVGIIIVIVIVIDVFDNIVICIFDVIVNDVEVLSVVCQDIMVNLVIFGAYNLNLNEIDGGFIDNCGVVGLGINIMVFDCDDVGEIFFIELIVFDNIGNFVFCMANVIVWDGDVLIVICVVLLIVFID